MRFADALLSGAQAGTNLKALALLHRHISRAIIS
jgi:hypothetical protein